MWLFNFKEILLIFNWINWFNLKVEMFEGLFIYLFIWKTFEVWAFLIFSLFTFFFKFSISRAIRFEIDEIFEN